MDFYLKAFLEGAWTASIIPLGNDTTFAAMRLFGGYNMHLAFLLATAGACLGQLFNYGVGRALLNQRGKHKFNVSDYWYARISTNFNKYCIFLILFCWAPLCNLLLVLAGFTRAPVKLPGPMLTAKVVIWAGPTLASASKSASRGCNWLLLRGSAVWRLKIIPSARCNAIVSPPRVVSKIRLFITYCKA